MVLPPHLSSQTQRTKLLCKTQSCYLSTSEQGTALLMLHKHREVLGCWWLHCPQFRPTDKNVPYSLGLTFPFRGMKHVKFCRAVLLISSFFLWAKTGARTRKGKKGGAKTRKDEELESSMAQLCSPSVHLNRLIDRFGGFIQLLLFVVQ